MKIKVRGLNGWSVVRAEARHRDGITEFVATARPKAALEHAPHVCFLVAPDWYEGYVEALTEGVTPVPPIGEELDVVAAWID